MIVADTNVVSELMRPPSAGHAARRWPPATARTAVAAAILAGGFTVWYRATHHAFPGQQVPRVHWCGRDYSIEDSPQTWRQVSARERSPVRAVGQYPPLAWWGQEVFVPSLPVMPHGPGEPCAIEVYLRTGQDNYQAYVLEGGF